LTPGSEQWKRLEADILHENAKTFALIQQFSLKLEATSGLQKVLKIATDESLIGAYFPVKMGYVYEPYSKLKVSEFKRDKGTKKTTTMRALLSCILPTLSIFGLRM